MVTEYVSLRPRVPSAGFCCCSYSSSVTCNHSLINPCDRLLRANALCSGLRQCYYYMHHHVHVTGLVKYTIITRTKHTAIGILLLFLATPPTGTSCVPPSARYTPPSDPATRKSERASEKQCVFLSVQSLGDNNKINGEYGGYHLVDCRTNKRMGDTG